MDDSMSSTNYMMISQSCSVPADSSEESSWTFYFEDFLTCKNDKEFPNLSSYDHHDYQASSSMVSDAAKPGNNNMVCKNKNFISRNKKSFFDEELEDTASSPAHSPKVINDLNKYMKSKDQLDYFGTQNVSQEKGESSMNVGGGNEMGFLETQLRRKGLCLVPVSMLLNHLS
ncbi:vascular-related unknown protein 4 isoform X1 [Amaranthus tricolor]|uniref:vascular-related unknown protein 4 isoform X1 n=1 Tax=Amaranthus tricolor TaxID=29722 RepID=UPI00258D41DB|nr:vascular-related unknown protein 4 isoform X1 [Amaranthus tricolor]